MPVFEDKAGDRRQLRALRPPAARPPRRGPGRVRLAQPALAGLRRRLRPRPGHPRHRLRAPDALRHGRARCTRPSAASGLRLRVYAPVGELVPGMAYLVRRLLENTSNESFVRHRFAEGRDLDELLAPPDVDDLPPADAGPPPAADRPGRARGRTRPSRWPSGGGPRRGGVPRGGGGGRAGSVALGRRVPALIGGRAGEHRGDHRVGRPGRPGHGRRDLGGLHRRATPTPRSPPPSRRAGALAAHAGPRSGPRVLFRAAEWLRARRAELAALECFEAGKPWDQADADVCEAIDFCEYYGREALRLEAPARRPASSRRPARPTGSPTRARA